jgi:hypothetical protein
VAVCAKTKAGIRKASDTNDEIVIIIFFMHIREGVSSLHPLAYTP